MASTDTQINRFCFRRRLLFIYLPAFALAFVVVPLAVTARAIADAAPSVSARPGRVILDGPIKAHTAPQFWWAVRRAAAAAPPGGELVVELNSPGGALTAAESMAWVLEQEARDRPVRAVVPAGAVCQSACTVVFLAAGRRQADPSAHFMFHLPDAPEGAHPALRWFVRATERVFQGYTRLLEDTSPGLVRYMVTQGVFHYRLDCHLSGAELGRAFPEFLETRPVAPTIDIPVRQRALTRLAFHVRHTCGTLGTAVQEAATRW
ncbi:hypothetical protein ACM64Y_17780 [Novispirillum sp. DQ9]|uniref:hypothetical protein n=1 Tax=Novispirillum sp. DQ9 TaxID=3398612 RepID=UPI003C79F613